MAQRSRSRSRSARRSLGDAAAGDTVATTEMGSLHALRLQVRGEYVHETQPFDYLLYMRVWHEHLRGGKPVRMDGQLAFPLCKECAELGGQAWARVEKPYLLRFGDSSYLLDVSVLHVFPSDAQRLPLWRHTRNGGKALVFTWPGTQGCRKVILSRILGMSLFFDEAAWGRAGCRRSDSRLHVHHVDGTHENMFLNNLKVISSEEHARHHARGRRRR